MANLAALLAHDVRGGEVIVEETAHIYNSEGGGLSTVAGAVARPLRGQRGMLDPDDVKAAIRGAADLALAPTRLVCLENTHNAAGGSVIPLESMAAIHQVCRHAGIPVHLDGARLFNAAAYLDVPILEICRHTDSVWFALCKGLGGPVGAILAGDGPFMTRARRAAKMLGGGMRQAGLIAAPVDRRPEGSLCVRSGATTRWRGSLPHGLAAIDASLVETECVQTNIVNCFVDRFADDASAINRALRQRGILANSKRTKIRFVTHCPGRRRPCGRGGDIGHSPRGDPIEPSPKQDPIFFAGD